MAESVEVDLEDEYLELPEDDKEGLIRYQFFRGFEYEEIRLFLQKNQPQNGELKAFFPILFSKSTERALQTSLSFRFVSLEASL